MKLEDQVISLDLAKKLKELGVKRESFYRWVEFPDRAELFPTSCTFADDKLWYFPAFTVAELGEMLPEAVVSGRLNSQQYACTLRESWGKENFFDLDSRDLWEISKAGTEADARGKLLIYLIENDLLKVEPTKAKKGT